MSIYIIFTSFMCNPPGSPHWLPVMSQLPLVLLCFAWEPVYDFIIQLLTGGGESLAMCLSTFPSSFASIWSPSN